MIDGAIKINNKTYYLKYTLNVLCEMEADGMDVNNLNTVSFRQLRALFYYGIKSIHKDEIHTEEQAGDLISAYIEDGGSLEELGPIMSNALSKSFGTKAVAEGK